MSTTIINPAQSKKDFRKCFEKLSYTQNYSTVFGDFVEYALLMMNIHKKAEDFAELEKRWPKPEDHRLFAEMFFSWSDSMQPFEDALGDLFMECVSFGRNGQFFTPEPICEMIARTTMDNNIPDGQSVADPACGSGRTLLAAAKLNRKLNFFGADNDQLCCKMTALNFLVNTMVGEVAHMDTLSLNHYKSWHINRFMDATGHYLPYYTVTGPGETLMVPKLKETYSDMNQMNKVKEIIKAVPITTIDEVKTSKHGQLILF